MNSKGCQQLLSLTPTYYCRVLQRSTTAAIASRCESSNNINLTLDDEKNNNKKTASHPKLSIMALFL